MASPKRGLQASAIDQVYKATPNYELLTWVVFFSTQHIFQSAGNLSTKKSAFHSIIYSILYYSLSLSFSFLFLSLSCSTLAAMVLPLLPIASHTEPQHPSWPCTAVNSSKSCARAIAENIAIQSFMALRGQVAAGELWNLWQAKLIMSNMTCMVQAGSNPVCLKKSS